MELYFRIIWRQASFFIGVILNVVFRSFLLGQFTGKKPPISWLGLKAWLPASEEPVRTGTRGFISQYTDFHFNLQFCHGITPSWAVQSPQKVTPFSIRVGEGQEGPFVQGRRNLWTTEPNSQPLPCFQPHSVSGLLEMPNSPGSWALPDCTRTVPWWLLHTIFN